MNPQEIAKKYGIAVTGGIASGKSFVCKMLADRGFSVVDADVLARQVVERGQPALQEIACTFGKEVIAPDGSLDRKRLREIISQDASARAKLNQITHPAIQKQLQPSLEKAGLLASPRLWFYEASLIFEIGRQNQFLEVWVVACSDDTQIARLKKRDGLTEAAAKQQIANQMLLAKKLPLATRVIWTDPGKNIDEQLEIALVEVKKKYPGTF